ncbi:HAD family hydrolase [Candidatus Pacearchaeota archaeon]|nr:HAD family hydrolase [Candidatus Pacearchaeota archaeon]
MAPKKVLVFDYDGTIVDSYRAYARRFVAIAGKYSLQASEHFFQSLYTGNFAASLQDHALDKKDVIALIHDIRVPFNGKPEAIEPFEGMVQLMNTLTKKYRVYVVTSNLTSVIKESLAYWKIYGVKEVIGGEMELSKVNKLVRIRKRYPRAELFYIGDTAGDVHEAKEAGYVAIAVSWGYHTKAQLEGEHPDILLSKVSELRALFV